MGDFTGILIFVGVAVVILIGIAWAMWMEKRRREELKEVAEGMSLTYFPHGDADLLSQLWVFKLFSRGRSKKLTNLIQGETDEVKIAIFDYQFTTGSGKNSHTVRQSVALLQSDALHIPEFAMRPEGMFDLFGGMFGQQDIDFEDHEEFSRMFILEGPDEQGIRELFKPPLLDFFAARKGMSVEGRIGSVIFYRPSHRVKPAEIRDFFEQAYQVYGTIVDHQ